jgi:aspartyl-tRNA(Asn)/glutamyl-tRNA(Gln) amidotransferase subunit A
MLDSIGPIARSVADCARADAVMAGDAEAAPVEAVPLAGLRLGIPKGFLLTEWDNTVGTRFGAAKKSLSDAGVRLSDEPMPLFDPMMTINQKGGIAPAEAFAIHREDITRRPEAFDPNVRARIERGAKLLAADYVDMARQRARLVRAMDAQVGHLDALVLPTTPIVAPTIVEMQDTNTFNTRNMLLLRNTNPWNFFDMCAISLPLPGAGLPVGLMLVARNGHDRRLFALAAAVERHFAT